MAAWGYLVAVLVMGVVGDTLPGFTGVVPVRWWNYLTLALSPPMIALIAATFVPSRPRGWVRRRHGTAAGTAGVVGTLVMACPVCNPLAIPLFGTAGVLSFLAPERGAIALLSIMLLAVTLILRLRVDRRCELKEGHADWLIGSPGE